MTATVTEVLARIRDNLDEQTPSNWTNQQLRRWLNEGLNDIARETRALKDNATFNTVASQAEYTAAANILEIDFAYFITTDGRNVPLTPVQYEGADQVWGQYQNQTSYQPSMFTTWGFPPLMKIRLFPVPNAINQILMKVSRTAVQIDITGAGDGSNIDFPEAWIDMVQDYCEMRALQKDRDQRWKDVGAVYAAKRDSLRMNDSLNINRNVVMDPSNLAGLPDWLVDWNYRG